MLPVNSRLGYFAIVLFVVGCGILSRQIDVIPLWIGDILYAVMVYFGCCFLMPKVQAEKIPAIACAICFFVEILQLYQPEWLTAIRKTILGHYALGEGFLWSDLLTYTIGILLAWCLDKLVLRNAAVSE